MIDKKQARLRRARKTRAKIAELKSCACRCIGPTATSTSFTCTSGAGCSFFLEPEVRKDLPNGGNTNAATVVVLVAERAKKAGVEQVAFDRCSGFQYHGRIKALAAPRVKPASNSDRPERDRSK